jgi:hypothetical protein
MLLGAAGEDGRDAFYTQFRGFLDGPFEVIEFEDGDEEMEREGGIRFKFFMKSEGDFLDRDGCYLGPVEETACDDIVDLACFGAEDVSKVVGLVAGKGCGGWGPGIGDKAAASHFFSTDASDWLPVGIATVSGS